MANVVQVIQRIVNDSIQKLRRVKLEEIEGDGGARLHSSNKKWYYNGVEIGTGGGGTGDECVFEQSGTYIAPKVPGSVHANGFQTSNSYNIQVGADVDCMRMTHDGGTRHRLEATKNLDLQSVNNSIRLISNGLSASVNGGTNFYNVLTSNVTGDVNFNDNASILNLNTLRFASLGQSSIYKGPNPMMFFDNSVGAYTTNFNYPVKMWRNKIYLNMESTDAASAYTFNDGVSGNTIHNVPTGKSHVFHENSVQRVSIGNGVLKADVPVDATGQKIYLYKQSTDAASMYIAQNTSNGNMIIHLPAGMSVEWQVG